MPRPYSTSTRWPSTTSSIEAVADIHRQTTTTVSDHRGRADHRDGYRDDRARPRPFGGRRRGDARRSGGPQAKARRPSLVLADIQLADDSSGIDAVKDIFAIPGAGDLHHRLSRAAADRRRPEPTFLITKPFSEEQVKASVSQALFLERAAHLTDAEGGHRSALLLIRTPGPPSCSHRPVTPVFGCSRDSRAAVAIVFTARGRPSRRRLPWPYLWPRLPAIRRLPALQAPPPPSSPPL